MPPTSGNAITGREYLRVSVDRYGNETSQNDQHADHVLTAESRTVTLVEPAYRDTGSASAYARKARTDFERLLDDLRKGRFGADELWLWENSRGSRDEIVWANIIDVCREVKVKIWIESEQRLYDCSIAQDRWDLLQGAIDSAKESVKTSKRITRRAGNAAAEGRPHGPCPVGYIRVFDQRTGKLISQEVDPEKSLLVRELFARLRRGHSLKGIARDWAARGIEKRSGGPYSAEQLRNMALNIAYIGMRSHTLGRKPGMPSSPDARIVPAVWSKIVPVSMFWAVNSKLRASDRRTSRTGAAKHLLTMFSCCHVCGDRMTVSYAKHKEGDYRCSRKGCTRIRRPALDKLIEKVLLEFLASPDAAEKLAEDADDSPLREARARCDELRVRLAEITDAVASGDMSATMGGAAEKRVLADLKAAERRERELATPAELAGLIEPGKDAAKRWAAAEDSTRREVARLLLVPELLGQLRIDRAPSRGKHFPAEIRVVFRRLIDGELTDLRLADLLEVSSDWVDNVKRGEPPLQEHVPVRRVADGGTVLIALADLVDLAALAKISESV